MFFLNFYGYLFQMTADGPAVVKLLWTKSK